LVQSIGCWLDRGSSKYELTVNYKKGPEFKQTENKDAMRHSQ